ncbi:MAG TPA: N-methyl-L-tryptophan oxidase [Rhizomicrobium sp.]
MSRYDVIIVGLGAMGSAALHQLAKRDVRVLGIDRFAPPHEQGSSHGDTRITRLAIGEGAHYTPLVKRSHEIWREIERETGADLLTQCGELIISSKNRKSSIHVDGFFQNTVDAACVHGIAHELLDASQIRARYPQFNIRDEEMGYFEAEAGFSRPEACIDAQLSLAKKHGAEIRMGETVLDFEPRANGVTVKTDRGVYQADKLVVAAGAWLPKFLGGDFGKLLKVYRQVLSWFAVDGDVAAYEPKRFPVFIWELPDSPQGIYGFPAIDGGLKVATEQYAATTSPDRVDRSVSAEEIEHMHRNYVAPYLKGVTSKCLKAKACLYTVTPDAGFILDTLPSSDRVIVASCCSGHGFKHSAAIGEALADKAEGLAGSLDLSPFRLGRFSA